MDVEFDTNFSVKTGFEKTTGSKVYSLCAFNICMGAAYHLMCYFSSLNDSVIQDLEHPLTIEYDKRDKSLKTVKITGFKRRANKVVDAFLSNEGEDEDVTFDVDKRNGVTFIETLVELSLLYGDGKRIFFTLDEQQKISPTFVISEITRNLAVKLHLTVEDKKPLREWFKELFYSLLDKGESIKLSTVTNEIGKYYVQRQIEILSGAQLSSRLLKIIFLSLSCYTDNLLKNIVLPLNYSAKDDNGFVSVSYQYVDGGFSEFQVPVKDVSFIKDIESWATARAPKKSKNPRYLMRLGSDWQPKQWEGISFLTKGFSYSIGLTNNEYYLQISSSRFRKTTSDQEYSDTNITHTLNILQNRLETLESNYTNGHPSINRLIISQAIQVIERIIKGDSIEQAKKTIKEKYKIEMLAYEKWLEKKIKSNPNGLYCNGVQDLVHGNKTQRATNKSLKQKLPCAEYDMCYLCRSAKGIDEPDSVYKLISFIDVLKESLNRFPDASSEVKERISAFEYVLDGASDNIFKQASKRFSENGRHPRVSIDHAIVLFKGGLK